MDQIEFIKGSDLLNRQKQMHPVRKGHGKDAENTVSWCVLSFDESRKPSRGYFCNRPRFKDLRRMAMELSYRHSNYKQKEIGAIFGVDYSTASQNRVRLKNKLKTSPKLKKGFDQFLKHIDNMPN